MEGAPDGRGRDVCARGGDERGRDRGLPRVGDATCAPVGAVDAEHRPGCPHSRVGRVNARGSAGRSPDRLRRCPSGAGGGRLGVRLAAVWAGQEGGLLLWALETAALGLALHPRRHPHAVAVVQFLCASLLGLAVSRTPFAPPPLAGAEGLNPMLDHAMMLIHPPMLFLGYALLATPLRSRWRRWCVTTAPPGRRLCAPGCSWLGSRSRQATASAPSGPTPHSAGGDFGGGTRWKIPPWSLG
jgi:hypothetical protein